MFAKKEKRFIFEGRHSASDKLVNGEVSAFTEEEARKNWQNAASARCRLPV